MKVIPGVMQFRQPGFLANAAAGNIAKKFRTTDQNNEEQVFFDLRSLPKSDYGPQFRNNIEGLEYHLEKAIRAVKVLLMEQSKPGGSEEEQQNSGRLDHPTIEENCEDRVDLSVTTISHEESMMQGGIEEFAAEKGAFLGRLLKMSVDPGDASLTCSLPNKEIISRGRRKVTAENIRVEGLVLKPAPWTHIGDSRLIPVALQADLSMELNVSLSLKVEILVKLFGSKVQLLPMLPVPETYAASLKGFGRVKLSVDVEDQNLQGNHAKIVFSFGNWEVDSLDLGRLQLLQLQQHTDATATTYNSIIKDYLKKELGEQRCKWNTKQLEEKAQQILDCKAGHG